MPKGEEHAVRMRARVAVLDIEISALSLNIDFSRCPEIDNALDIPDPRPCQESRSRNSKVAINRPF